MLHPKDHGGIAATVDFGYIRIAVLADCTVCKTSTGKTYQLMHKPVPDMSLGATIAAIGENRAQACEAPLWDEVEKYPFKLRAMVSAFASAMCNDPEALFYELSELGLPLDLDDAMSLSEAVIETRRRKHP